MMTADEFAASIDLPAAVLADAYDLFQEQLQAHRKTLAHRLVDMADGLRQLGLDEGDVIATVHLLAMERRR